MTEFQPTEFPNRGFADQLNIQTPEQVELRFPVAGIGSRFVAVLVDHLIQVIAFLLLVIGLAWLGSSGKSAPTDSKMSSSDALKWGIAIFSFLIFLLIWGYFSLFEGLWKGQTPGKRLMKLRVIKDTGRPITLFEAMARNLVRFVDFAIPGLYLAGVVTMLCNGRNKRLGDLAAGTIVVHEIATADRSMDVFLSDGNFFAQPQQAVNDDNLPADAISRLDGDDLRVMETFFARALDLDPATRANMAARIAAKMAAKMQVPMPEGNPERMLEKVARAMRGLGRRF